MEGVTIASIGCKTKNHETEEETEEAADYGGGLLVYDRKRLKRAGIKLNDDCPFRVK